LDPQESITIATIQEIKTNGIKKGDRIFKYSNGIKKG